MLVDLPRLLPHQVGVVAHLEPQLTVWNISGRDTETSNFLLSRSRSQFQWRKPELFSRSHDQEPLEKNL